MFYVKKIEDPNGVEDVEPPKPKKYIKKIYSKYK